MSWIFSLVTCALLRRKPVSTALMIMVCGCKLYPIVCKSSYCILLEGMEHAMEFTYCNCEPLTMTLARAKLWPATPTNPHYAFSFSLFDLVESLLLECQVAFKDICNALIFRAPFYNPKVHYIYCNILLVSKSYCTLRITFSKRDFYSVMINSFEECR